MRFNYSFPSLLRPCHRAQETLLQTRHNKRRSLKRTSYCWIFVYPALTLSFGFFVGINLVSQARTLSDTFGRAPSFITISTNLSIIIADVRYQAFVSIISPDDFLFLFANIWLHATSLVTEKIYRLSYLMCERHSINFSRKKLSALTAILENPASLRRKLGETRRRTPALFSFSLTRRGNRFFFLLPRDFRPRLCSGRYPFTINTKRWLRSKYHEPRNWSTRVQRLADIMWRGRVA